MLVVGLDCEIKGPEAREERARPCRGPRRGMEKAQTTAANKIHNTHRELGKKPEPPRMGQKKNQDNGRLLKW